MNKSFWLIVKDKAYETMATIGIVVSVTYIMRHLGFEGPGIIPYNFCWASALGWFIGLVLIARYNSKHSER